MWQFLLFLIVLLIIGGIIFYGWAKLVVAGVLITAAVSVVMFFTYGIVHELRQPPKSADPNHPSADEFRAMKDRDRVARVQARVLSDVAIVDVPAGDAESAELRRLAGLDGAKE
jgi:hypothetical protein